MQSANTALSWNRMTYGILFEKMGDGDSMSGNYYAHVPALGLTTHGEGIEGARAAAMDLVMLWIAEKRAAGEPVPQPAECLFSTMEIPDDVLQSA